jgi:hypothetical protein
LIIPPVYGIEEILDQFILRQAMILVELLLIRWG